MVSLIVDFNETMIVVSHWSVNVSQMIMQVVSVIPVPKLGLNFTHPCGSNDTAPPFVVNPNPSQVDTVWYLIISEVSKQTIVSLVKIVSIVTDTSILTITIVVSHTPCELHSTKQVVSYPTSPILGE